ncbi:MAG: extracellular solute-binding protein [Puniceicoccaceae bacterium]|nr:MAG: extracellular solute-binding protein [Puniceicoccaceae bacterium]
MIRLPPGLARLALAASALAFASLPALAETTPAGGETVTFRAQGLPSPTDTRVTALAARTVLRAFLDQNPGIEIQAFAMPQIGGTVAMDAAPLMAISAGVPPHAIYVNFRQSSTYLAQGFLAPMEVLLARLLSDNPAVRQSRPDGSWLADPTAGEIAAALEKLRARVPAPTWPVVFREDESGLTRERHVWALPTSNLVSALFYRRDLFNEAGLDPERPPETWAELLEYARILRVPERQQFGMLFGSGQTTSYQAYAFLVSNRARAVALGEDGEWRAVYDSREAAEAVEFFWRLIREPFERDGRIIRGAAGLTAGALSLEWERGKVGMQFGYLDEEMLEAINPQLVGIAPVPRSPRGAAAGELNARMLGVFSDATPKQQLAVMRYIWFLTGREARELRTRVFVENGFGQFVNPDLLEEFGYERLLARIPEGWRTAFETALAEGVPEPYGRNTQNIYRWMSEPINRALDESFPGLDQESRIDVIQGYLAESVREVNLKVMGLIPPEEMTKRRIVGGLVLALVAAAFIAGLGHIWNYFSRAAPPVSLRNNWNRYVWGYVLLVPGFGLILMWQYLPLLTGGLTISLMDYRIVQDSIWVGVDNFANVLFDDKFWSALGRSFHFVALAIGLGFWPPILLAILLQEVPTKTAKYIYRTIFYLPSVLIGVVVMFLWKQLYDPSEEGVLNKILLSLNYLDPASATVVKLAFFGLWVSFVFVLLWLPVKLEELPRLFKAGLWAAGGGCLILTLWPVLGAGSAGAAAGAIGTLFGRFDLEPLEWIQSPRLAMLCIIIPMVWASTGPGCIIYLAALKGIPNELYEAAEIDGANHWHKVFYIVLPRLKYLIVIQFVAAVVAAFKGGEEFILVMTGGGPGDATTILSLEIFFRTFMDLEFGLGTAMAWLMGALLIGFSAYQLKILSRAEFRAGG